MSSILPLSGSSHYNAVAKLCEGELGRIEGNLDQRACLFPIENSRAVHVIAEKRELIVQPALEHRSRSAEIALGTRPGPCRQNEDTVVVELRGIEYEGPQVVLHTRQVDAVQQGPDPELVLIGLLSLFQVSPQVI